MTQYMNIRNGLMLLTAVLLMVGCTPTEEAVVPPPTAEDAAFSFSRDAENPNKLIFTATSEVDAWYTHWAFGDNSAAEGMAAEKTYPLAGEYDVRFKVFTEGGTAETVQQVVIEEDLLGPNLITNGEFDGEAGWTLLPISGGVEVSIADGVASWAGGGWGQMGIYQAIEVEANRTYQIDMDIIGGGLSDCWFEVYAGKAAPVVGQDYTDGGIRLALNTWDGCGVEPFEGLLSGVSCAGSGNTFEFDAAGTVYIVIRGGGADYGNPGVTLDNVWVRPL